MRLRGIGYASAASLMFGLGVVLAKLLSGELDATIVAVLALGAGGLLLAICLLLTGIPFLRILASLKPADWLQLFLLACPGTALPLLLIVAGFARTSALEGGLLLQMNGLAAMLFAVLLLRERINLKQGLGTLLLLLGGILIVLGGASGGGASGWGGDLLILIGALALGFGFVPAKRLADAIDPLTLSALRLLIGAVCVVPVLAVQLVLQKGALLWQPSITSLWALPLYIVTNFCLAYLIQQAGFGLLKAWEMAAILQSVPLFSTTFAVLMLGDTITLLQGIGGLLALLGGLAVALSARKTAAATPAAAAEQSAALSCPNSE
ncbi:MAG TPA: EamA family transporter [Ktedonobacterales bacterium]|nr:EamA family transporter [Ktedonobacterales bacterium]